MRKLIALLNSLDISIQNRSVVIRIYRYALTLTTLLHFMFHVAFYQMLFSDVGILNITQAEQQTQGFSILFFDSSEGAVASVFVIGMIACLLSLLNFFTNLQMFFMFVCFVSLMDRLPFAGYGGSQVLTIGLFLGIFTPWKPNQSIWQGWAIRCTQIQFCYVYFFSALEKIRNDYWYFGEALQQIAYNQLSIRGFSNILRIPLVSFLGNYLTLAVELLFPIIVWNRQYRLALILIAFLFHFFIGMTISAFLFPLVMMSLLVTFLEDNDFVIIRNFFNRIRKKYASN